MVAPARVAHVVTGRRGRGRGCRRCRGRRWCGWFRWEIGEDGFNGSGSSNSERAGSRARAPARPVAESRFGCSVRRQNQASPRRKAHPADCGTRDAPRRAHHSPVADDDHRHREVRGGTRSRCSRRAGHHEHHRQRTGEQVEHAQTSTLTATQRLTSMPSPNSGPTFLRSPVFRHPH